MMNLMGGMCFILGILTPTHLPITVDPTIHVEIYVRGEKDGQDPSDLHPIYFGASHIDKPQFIPKTERSFAV
jgi:hypothetical protein